MDLHELIRQAAAEVLAEGKQGNAQEGTPQPAPQPAAQPITLNVNGQPVTFKDQADLEAQLNQFAAQYNQLQQQVSTQPTPDPRGTRVSGRDDDQGFSRDEYIRLMNEDPLGASNYALSHLIFEGKVDNPAEIIRETLIDNARIGRQLAAYQFRDIHSEVPLEDPRVGNTIETVRRQLNLPFTTEGLEAAYAYSVQKGHLPDFRLLQQAQQQQQQGQQGQQGQPGQQFQQPPQPQFQAPVQNPGGFQISPQNPYLQGPPSMTRSASTPALPVTEGQIEDMSLDQLRKLMDKLNSVGAV